MLTPFMVTFLMWSNDTVGWVYTFGNRETDDFVNNVLLLLNFIVFLVQLAFFIVAVYSKTKVEKYFSYFYYLAGLVVTGFCLWQWQVLWHNLMGVWMITVIGMYLGNFVMDKALMIINKFFTKILDDNDKNEKQNLKAHPNFIAFEVEEVEKDAQEADLISEKEGGE